MRDTKQPDSEIVATNAGILTTALTTRSEREHDTENHDETVTELVVAVAGDDPAGCNNRRPSAIDGNSSAIARIARVGDAALAQDVGEAPQAFPARDDGTLSSTEDPSGNIFPAKLAQAQAAGRFGAPDAAQKVTTPRVQKNAYQVEENHPPTTVIPGEPADVGGKSSGNDHGSNGSGLQFRLLNLNQVCLSSELEFRRPPYAKGIRLPPEGLSGSRPQQLISACGGRGDQMY